MTFSVVLEPVAINDVQLAIDYYDDKELGLGNKFEEVLNLALISLTINPHFQKRYRGIHCLPLKKFPYMIHFTIDEEVKTVIIRAVFHTSQNPDLWKDRWENE